MQVESGKAIPARLSRQNQGARPRLCALLYYLALALCLCAIAPFAYDLAFVFAQGDDFDSATRAMFIFDLPGGLYEIGREWLTWSGRYSYHFLAVFLGKAADSRLGRGLVCAAVFALYALAVFWLSRQSGIERKNSALQALLALLAICACHSVLGNFYLYTDALTSALNPALSLLFIASLLKLWLAPEKCGNLRKARRKAIICGVIAVGIFEYAALAVNIASLIFLLLALKASRGKAKQGEERPGTGRTADPAPVLAADPAPDPAADSAPASAPDPPLFFQVWLWVFGATLFSFFAPGNFIRSAVRKSLIEVMPLDERLSLVFGNALDFLWHFATSLWPLAVLGLVLLWRSAENPGLPIMQAQNEAHASAAAPFPRWLIPLLSVLGYLGLLFACLFLQSFTDKPARVLGKMGANLDCYAAIALAFALHALLPRLKKQRLQVLLALCLAIPPLCLASPNWREAEANAVNGKLPRLARALTARDAWLRRLASEAQNALPPQERDRRPRLGLIGEYYRPDARKRRIDPRLPQAVVQSYERRVYPVWGGECLPDQPEKWPNFWVAWLYGLGSVRSARLPEEQPGPGEVAQELAPEAGEEK